MTLMTRGFEELTMTNPHVSKVALELIHRVTGSEFDFGVGKRCEQEHANDEGRTLVLPFDGPTIFAAINETDGVTLMLADEY